MSRSRWGKRCVLDVVLEEVTFELGFETHRGLPEGWGLGGHGKDPPGERCQSRAVRASNMHWLPLVPSAMMKNK